VRIDVGDELPAVPESGGELERFFDLALDLLVIAGLDGHMKRVNPAYARTLGYPMEELLARPMLAVVHPDDVESVRTVLSGLLDGEDVLGFENRVICADGSVRWLQWNTRAMPERGIVYGVGRDVTERRRADAELRSAQRMIDASHDELRVLANEQAALRRVATLVARGVPPAEVFLAVAAEVSGLFGSDVSAIVRFEDDRTATVLGDVGGPHEAGTRVTLDRGYVVDTVRETSRSARFDTDDPPAARVGTLVRSLGVQSAVASPIVVEGELWGAITVASLHGPLSPRAERQLTDFTELVATAVANTEAREAVTILAEEQAALRRVAELVAREAPQTEVFSAIAAEIGRLTGSPEIRMLRFEGDAAALVVAGTGKRTDAFAVGSRLPLGDDTAVSRVFRTGEPARTDEHRQAGGPIARSVVATPIVVEGRPWGAMLVATFGDESVRPDTESRFGRFTELLATAIANAEARAEIERLADEQAALRRVATLVAQGASAATVFDAVAAEMELLLGADGVTLSRYESDDEVTVVAQSGVGAAVAPAGTRLSLTGDSVAAKVRRTRRAARIEDYTGRHGAIAKLIRDVGVHSAVGAPIVVAGELWGVTITLWGREHAPPGDTEERIVQFAELLGTAIANADSRDQLTASRARLVTEADHARRRVVRDLHDGAQQRLVHTIVMLKLARHAINEGDGKAESLVVEALQHAERGKEELRELARGILPAALTAGGLQAGVNALVARLDLPVHVNLPAVRLRAEIEASAYFTVAESLTNIMKHSHASHAEVTATVEDDVLQVDVRDDGIGGAEPEGRGLVGIADRVSALGGELTVESAVGCGTHVSARFPLTGMH
jgi:PAS domain S-box-containing protein